MVINRNTSIYRCFTHNQTQSESGIFDHINSVRVWQRERLFEVWSCRPIKTWGLNKESQRFCHSHSLMLATSRYSHLFLSGENIFTQFWHCCVHYPFLKRAMIHFLLLFSRQGKLRLQKWFDTYQEKTKKKITRDLVATILKRKSKMCSFIEWQDMKIVYKRYASLYFCAAIDVRERIQFKFSNEFHLHF